MHHHACSRWSSRRSTGRMRWLARARCARRLLGAHTRGSHLLARPLTHSILIACALRIFSLNARARAHYGWHPRWRGTDPKVCSPRLTQRISRLQIPLHACTAVSAPLHIGPPCRLLDHIILPFPFVRSESTPSPTSPRFVTAVLAPSRSSASLSARPLPSRPRSA